MLVTAACQDTAASQKQQRGEVSSVDQHPPLMATCTGARQVSVAAVLLVPSSNLGHSSAAGLLVHAWFMRQRCSCSASPTCDTPSTPCAQCCCSSNRVHLVLYGYACVRRLEQCHLGELLEFAPKDELSNILRLVCNMFRVKNALVSLFFDRSVYIIDGTGVFQVRQARGCA